jgi:hypothetical protein
VRRTDERCTLDPTLQQECDSVEDIECSKVELAHAV